MTIFTDVEKLKIFKVNNYFTILAIGILVFIWKLGSMAIGAEIILPSPEKTFTVLIKLVVSPDFLLAVAASLTRVGLGFAISCAAGLVLGGIAGYSSIFGAFLKPLNTVLRAVPVMSIILLAMIWFETQTVPVFVCFLIAFPIIYGNILEGIKKVSPQLIELSDIYKIPIKRRIKRVYLPSIYSFFLAGAYTALGLTWKVVVAAEVLSQPAYGIGSRLIESKIYLETAHVFAWTVLAIILSAASEAVFRYVLRRPEERMHHG